MPPSQPARKDFHRPALGRPHPNQRQAPFVNGRIGYYAAQTSRSGAAQNTVARERTWTAAEQVRFDGVARISHAAGHHPIFGRDPRRLSRATEAGRTKGASSIHPKKHAPHGSADGGGAAHRQL